ncbi:MAG TPA: biotin/lipoyl-containing protein [Kofleriaceae bacterium]
MIAILDPASQAEPGSLPSEGDALRAPAPGWFHRTVQADHLVLEGDPIGELDVLGRVTRVLAPRVRGVVRLEAVEARRAVAYGDVLMRIVAAHALGSAEGPAREPAHAAGGPVFRAPTSGRYYGRPSPDKPPFLAVGAELAPGATVCLLEVMKTFHRVTYAGAAARVRELLVAEGSDVNAGDALVALDPI